MKRISLIFVVLLLLIGGIAIDAYALDMEYYVYNGFDPVVTAFQKIALIFSDSGYRALFFTIIVLGIFFGAAAVYFKAFVGARVSPLAWAWPVGIGVVLYLALIIPKGQLTIYDPVLNRFQTVGDIPDGIVAVAGVLNKIERGFIDIISTSGDPYSYPDSAGGIGFDILLKGTASSLKPGDQYITESLRKYSSDCLFFELQRPGTNLSVNDITSNSTNFLDQFAQAVNPAVFTVWYDGSACKTGCTMSCTDAWNNLNSYLSDLSNLDGAEKAVCAASGLNPNNANEFNKCKSLIRDYVQYTGGISLPSSTNYIRQTYMAQVLQDTLLSANPDLALRAIANRNIMTSGIGIGISANEWLPIVRAVVIAVALGLIPFLVIFIPTPLSGKAVGTVAGFFVWLTAWGVTDAITHGIATDYGYKVFEYVRQNQLGFAAMMTTPDATIKALSMFGLIRTSGIMLATVITGMLIKFGGHALAMMAGNLSGSIQSHGASAAMQTQTPEGQAHSLSSLEAAPPVMANAHKFDFSQRTKARTFEKATQTETSLQTVAELGGNAFTAAGRAGEMNAFNTATGVERVKNLREQDVTPEKLGDTQAKETVRGVKKREGFSYPDMEELGRLDGKKERGEMDTYGAQLSLVKDMFGAGDREAAAMIKAAGINPMGTLGKMDAYNRVLGKHGFGNDVLEFKRFEGKNHALDKKQAEHLNVTPGMSLSHVQMDDKGNVASYEISGVSRDGSSVRTTYDGKGNLVNETGSSGGKREERISVKEALEKFKAYKGTDFYEGLKEMDPKRNVAFNYSYGKDGRLAKVKAEQGAHSLVLDKADTKRGTDKETTDRDVYIADRGTDITNKAFQMALKGEQAIVRPVTNQYLSEKQREAEIAALSVALGKGASEFMTRKGVSADFAKGEAHLSVGAGVGVIFKAEGGARGAVGGQRTDEKATDLMVQQYDSLIRSTLKESREKGLDRDATRALLSSRIEDYTNAFYNRVQSNSPEEYGFSSPGHALTKLGKKAVDSVGIVPSPYHPDYKGKR